MRLLPLVLACAAALSGQTVVVQGNVYNSITGTPIAGAQVSVRGMVGSDTTATVTCATDAAGHFEASMPGPVAYSLLSVSRAGFVAWGGAIPNDPEAPRPPQRVLLMPEAVISGKVMDEDGFPAEGAWVEILRYNFTAEGRKLIKEGGAPVNDLGEYRIFNVPYGLYYLRVVPSGRIAQWDARYIPEYYLGTLEPRLENRVRVEAGQEQHGIDFRLTRHEGVTISGHVVMPAGAPTPVALLESVEDHMNPPRSLALDPADGGFVARHVPPGTWALRAMAGSGQLQPGDFLAERTYKVGDTDIRDIVLTPRAIEPQDVTGKVIFEGGVQPHAIVVGLRRNTGQVSSARTGDDGSFVIHGVLPGHYRIDVQATNSDSVAGIGPGFAVSARLGDREVLRQGFDLDGAPPGGPLQVTVTEAVAILEGKLVDKNGLPVAGGRVMLYGDWCRFAATTDRDGAFHFDHLYRGEYRVVPLARNNGNPEDSDVPPVQIVEGRNPPLVLKLQ